MAIGGVWRIGFCFVTCIYSIRALQIYGDLQQLPEIEPQTQTDPSFDGLLPIKWVHVPKAGSSFLQNLLHIPGACPGLPADLEVPSLNINTRILDPSWKCNTSILDLQDLGSHASLDYFKPAGGFDETKGRYMTMMRQPEQRLLSELHWQNDHRVNMKINGHPLYGGPWSLENLTTGRSGTMTNILAGANSHYGNFRLDMPPPTRAVFEKAKIRLQTGFSFIGITDEWNLSMCLFNKMFNQKCHAFQFADSQPTFEAQKLHGAYDINELDGFRDTYDDELYDIGIRIFRANLEKYDVSESSCKSCMREAGMRIG